MPQSSPLVESSSREASNRRARVIVAGHICLDIIPSFAADAGGAGGGTVGGHTRRESRLEAIRPGALVHVGPAALSTGGAVANTGLTLHRLGVETRLIAAVGDDLFGRTIRERIEGEGASTHDLLTTPEVATSYTIVINPPDIDRSFLHCPGANDVFNPDEVSDAALADARLLHFGYPPLMRGIYADGGAGLARLFERAKKRGLTTTLDMAFPDPSSDAGRVDWSRFLERVLGHVDVFLPSLEEIASMLGGETNANDAAALPDQLEALSTRLLGMGTGAVFLKLGEAGLYARVSDDPMRIEQFGSAGPRDWATWRGGERWISCFQVDEAGTTGAGDATVAGVLAGLLRGDGLDDTLTFAVGVGACCVEAADAISAIVPADRVARRIRAGWRHRSAGALPPHWRDKANTGIRIGPHDRLG